jgi:hypothetical protein
MGDLAPAGDARVGGQPGIRRGDGLGKVGVGRGRHEQRLGKRPAVAIHQRLRDGRLGKQRLFDPFGRHVAAEAGDDEVGFAALDPQPPGLVDPAEVARGERARRLRVSERAEAQRIVEQKFSVRRYACPDMPERRADAAVGIARLLQRDDRGAFGQAIALQHGQADGPRALDQRDRNLRAADGDQRQLRQALIARLERGDEPGEVLRHENQRGYPPRSKAASHEGKVGTKGIAQASQFLRRADIRASSDEGGEEPGDRLEKDAGRQQRAVPSGMLRPEPCDHARGDGEHVVGGEADALRLAGRARSEADPRGAGRQQRGRWGLTERPLATARVVEAGCARHRDRVTNLHRGEERRQRQHRHAGLQQREFQHGLVGAVIEFQRHRPAVGVPLPQPIGQFLDPRGQRRIGDRRARDGVDRDALRREGGPVPDRFEQHRHAATCDTRRERQRAIAAWPATISPAQTSGSCR